MEILGIIPARGGSKRIPRKNLKKLNGKPLIAWTILPALKSKLSRVIVSTDDPEIARVAKKYGAEVPFVRPKELAKDTGGIEPVLKHAYNWLADNEHYKADALALLMPTNPARQVFHINEAIDIFKNKKADSVVSVNETPANHTPYWTLVKSKSGKIGLFGGVNLKNILDRSQDFPQKCYARNDLIYILKPKNLFEKKPNLYGGKIELYVTSPRYEVDINTPGEFEEADAKLKLLVSQARR